MASKVQNDPVLKQNVQESNRFSRDNVLSKLPSVSVQADTLTKLVNRIKEYEAEQESFKRKLGRLQKISEDRKSLWSSSNTKSLPAAPQSKTANLMTSASVSTGNVNTSVPVSPSLLCCDKDATAKFASNKIICFYVCVIQALKHDEQVLVEALALQSLSLETEMCRKKDKLTALQKALSQLQNKLLVEQEEKQTLKNKIEILKMKETESAKKIQSLLQMTRGVKFDDDIVYTFHEPLGLHVRQRVLSTQSPSEEQTAVKGVYENGSAQSLLNQQARQDTLETLRKQNESIEAIVNKQSELTRSRIEAIVADCNITMKEAELMSKYDREKIQHLANKLKQTEADLISLNSEFLDVKKNLHREEILRDIQKDILLKHVMNSLKRVSLNDTAENIIANMTRIIDNASELFKSIENDGFPANSNLNRQNSECQTENVLNVDIYPSQVYSEIRSRSLENLSNNKTNKHVESANSHPQHVDSTGQFIHYWGDSGDHHRSPYKSVSPHRTVSFSSVSPDHNKENLPERSESVPHFAMYQPRSCLKTRVTPPETSSTYKSTKKKPLPESGVGVARPKTADPRRRQPPQNVVLRPHSVNQKKNSDVLKKTSDSPGPHLIGDQRAKEITTASTSAHAKNSAIGGLSETGFFVPFPRMESHKQLLKQASALSKKAGPKSSHVMRTTSKSTQCNFSTGDETSYHQNGYATDRVSRSSHGLFTPRVQQNVRVSTKLPHTTTQSHHDTELFSSVFEDSASETRVKTRDMYHSKPFDVSSPRYCNERIDSLKEYVKSMNFELQEIRNRFFHDQNILQSYKERCAFLEHALSFQRNEYEKLDDQQKKGKESLAEQLNVTKSRLSKLERYRRLEVEGFRTDIRMLTQKVRDMEKQLYKTVLIYEAGGKDAEFLQAVHATTKKSMHVSNEVLRLKAKLYQLESSLKQL